MIFCEGLGRPGGKKKESAPRTEKIPSNMVIHNHVDGEDTIFSTMLGTLVKNHLGKWLGVIIRGTCQSASEDIRWAYELVSDLCPYIEPNSDSIDDGSSDEGSKYQDNPYDHKQEEVVSVTRRNPRRLRRGDQRSLKLLKTDIEKSKDKLFFIKHRDVVSSQVK